MGILLALTARGRSSKGQYIDVGIADGITSWLPLALYEYLTGDREPSLGTHIYQVVEKVSHFLAGLGGRIRRGAGYRLKKQQGLLVIYLKR
jgi:crotonobetainyl-CoA:carnitine CoA-transferase CaiB-like acyl-CoA transferase